MILKKPGLLLATGSCLHSFPLCAGRSSTSSTSDHRPITRQSQCILRGDRPYATTATEGSEDGANCKRPKITHHDWPQPPKGHSHPTPYQIFSLKRGAPYSKSRFYDLVKLYHPDISDPSTSSSLPRATRIERYRLIVAANSILSDPEKRSAYDRFGAGWNGRAEAASPWRRGGRTGDSGPFTSHNWQQHPDAEGDPTIFRNATWEDWERFYARRAQGNSEAEYPPSQRRAPVYMANTYFLALVVGLSILGSSLNYGRAQDAGTYFVEQRDLVHDRSAKDLRRVRREVEGLGSKEGRIEFFVRQREATLGVYAEEEEGQREALREERAERVLGGGRETCGSEGVRGREM